MNTQKGVIKSVRWELSELIGGWVRWEDIAMLPVAGSKCLYPWMKVEMDQNSLAISRFQIGGTYHIYGLCKAYVREYPPQNMAFYGTVPTF